LEQALSSTEFPVISKTEAVRLFLELKHSGRFQALIDEARELDRLAVPLYKEMLSSNPFYQARMHDDQFWSRYVGSRVVQARDLVAASKTTGTSAVDLDHPDK
jgi:hypothetical protein